MWLHDEIKEVNIFVKWFLLFSSHTVITLSSFQMLKIDTQKKNLASSFVCGLLL